MDQSQKPPLVFNVVDYGAVGNGVVDDTAAIRRAAAALQAAGGGTIFFPPLVYNIFQSTTGTLCAFSGLTGVKCLGYGATLQVYLLKVITASEGYLFQFSGCNNITVDGFTTNGPTLDVSQTVVKGYQFVNCSAGCRNISMPNNRVVNAILGFQSEKQLADPDADRTQNIHIGVMDVVNCWYGVTGIYSGDFMRVDCLRTDTIHRSCLIYGASNLDLTIYSKDPIGSSDANLLAEGGVAMTDVRLNYYSSTDTTASLVSPKVKIGFGNQTPSLMRNIFINLNVEYAASGDTGGSALFIVKLTNAGAPDVVDRGHHMQNLVISGTIDGSPSYNDGGLIVMDTLSVWGTGDYFSNIALENLRIEAASGPDAVALTLGNCIDQILVKNVYSNGPLAIRNGATGDLRLPFVATTLLENVQCTNRWAYDGAYLPIDNIRATTTPDTVRAGWTWHSITNTGIGGDMIWQLPAAVVGLEYLFQRTDAYILAVDPNGSEVIRGSGAGVAVSLTNAGDFLHLKCYITGIWEILSAQGIYAPIASPTFTGTLTTGTGAISLRGDVTVAASKTLTVGDGTQNAQININSLGTPNHDRLIAFQSGGLNRWLVRATQDETGADAGSNFFIQAKTDAGGTIDSPVTIIRAAAGAITLARPTTLSALATFSAGLTFGGSTLANYVAATTWTPTLIGSGTAGTPTYAAQLGRYTRIGSMVMASAYISITAKTAIAGDIRVGGLPIAIGASEFCSAAIGAFAGFTFAAGRTQLAAYNGGGVSYLALTVSGSGVAPINVTDADIAAATSIFLTICYEV